MKLSGGSEDWEEWTADERVQIPVRGAELVACRLGEGESLFLGWGGLPEAGHRREKQSGCMLTGVCLGLTEDEVHRLWAWEGREAQVGPWR